ncbi:MAG: dihydrofolate reductase family protein [Rubrivivax sp.]|nr:dihydrofolate reductase family protein [Rubrivivax sp.]
MPPTCSVFIATSLDGFIARPDGAIDWLERLNATVPAGEDCGYARFMESVDALVMGRASVDKVLGFPARPCGDQPVDGLSGSMPQLPPGTPPTVTLLKGASAAPAEVLRTAAAAGHRRLYIDGGRTIQSFLAAGLIAELTATTVPVLLGAGIRLFGALHADVPLGRLSSQA